MKASRDIPTWNSDESDVLPAFRLTYGHILTKGLLAADEVLEKLNAGRLHVTEPFSGIGLPEQADGNFGYEDRGRRHFLFASEGGYTAVFCDRSFFLRNNAWIEMSRKTTDFFAVVTATEADTFFYYIFRRGELLCNAVSEAGNPRIVAGASISVSLGGKVVQTVREEPQCAHDEILNFLRYDLSLHVRNKRVCFHRTLSPQDDIDPECLHVISEPDSKPGVVGRLCNRLLKRR